jgi:hypothetical protein
MLVYICVYIHICEFMYHLCAHSHSNDLSRPGSVQTGLCPDRALSRPGSVQTGLCPDRALSRHFVTRIYACMHACMHACMCVCVWGGVLCPSACTPVCVCVCVYLCVRACTYMYSIYTYIHVFMYLCTFFMYTWVYVNICVHMYITCANITHNIYHCRRWSCAPALWRKSDGITVPKTQKLCAMFCLKLQLALHSSINLA